MTLFKVNPTDIFFILKEQLEYGALCKLQRYRGMNEKTLDPLVTEALRFARGVVILLQEIGEKPGVEFERGARNRGDAGRDVSVYQPAVDHFSSRRYYRCYYIGIRKYFI